MRERGRVRCKIGVQFLRQGRNTKVTSSYRNGAILGLDFLTRGVDGSGEGVTEARDGRGEVKAMEGRFLIRRRDASLDSPRRPNTCTGCFELLRATTNGRKRSSKGPT